MRSRAKNTTKEQDEYRAAILRKKYKERIKTWKPKVILEPETREWYMNNCMFWINKYYKGEVDKERLKKAVLYLKQYCDEILVEAGNKNIIQ